jgi:hypothetical protein
MIDLLSIAACVAAAAGCFVLHRRVRRLESTEGGIGKAVIEMSQSVSRLQEALTAAEEAARDASARFDERLAETKALAGLLGREGIGRSGALGAVDARKRDPLSDVAPKGLGDGSSPAGPQAASKAVRDVKGREALARFAIAARAADRRSARGDAGAAA